MLTPGTLAGRALVFAALLCCALLLPSGPLRALPPDFEQTLVIGNLQDPVSMGFAPDGRLFILERVTGKIRVMTAAGVLLPDPFATMAVPPVAHRSGGLRALAFDPDFANNGYIYVFYTRQFEVKRHNRVSRLQADPANPNRALANSETVLMELPFNTHAKGSSGSHNGGAIFFGQDGKLYFTTGDGWQASDGYGAGDNVQSLNTLTGKLFRINVDGSIPTDNPFYNQTTGDYRAIYALGFRNPYSGGIHPITGEIYIYDVGEVWSGNKDYIYRIFPGANGRHDGGSSVSIGTLLAPWVKTGSRVISGGAWYVAPQFPAEYYGSLFVCAWGDDDIRRITSDSDTTNAIFADDGVADNGPVYVQVGPDGALYYLITTYLTSTGAIYRIAYTGTNTAAAPVITPAGGTYVVSAEISMNSFTPGAEIRYTLDGSTPTAGSTLYTAPFSLTSSATVKARAFKAGLDPSNTASVNFTIEPGVAPAFTSTPPETALLGAELVYDATASGSPAPTYSIISGPPEASLNASSGLLRWTPTTAEPATFTLQASNGIGTAAEQEFSVNVLDVRLAENPPGEELTPGLHVTVFDGAVPPLADLRLLAGSASGTAAGLDPTPLGRAPPFAARYEGYLEIPATGDYTFTLDPAGAARLRLGTQTLLETTGAAAQHTIGLEAGRHLFTLEYFPGASPGISLSWSGPGLALQAVPESALSRKLQQPGVFLREPSPPFLNFPATENERLPATLSATGAFADVAQLIPAPGLIPFDVISPLWSDGAAKYRWLALPTGTRITWLAGQHWDFPPGSVFIKHFELGTEGYRLETRFTIVKADGSIYGVTYRWRADYSDADLVGLNGLSEEVRFDLGQRQTWAYPSRGDCLSCHTPSGGYVLGPRTGQLNGPKTYANSAVADNQLHTLMHLGVFNNPPDPAALAGAISYSALADDGAPLVERLKSYFAANCAMCHNPANTMEGAAMDLRFTTSLENMGLLDTPASNSLGIGGAMVVKSADAHRSVLYQRLATNNPAHRMPPLARSVVDTAATARLLEWIGELEPPGVGVDVLDYAHRWRLDSNLQDEVGETDGAWRAGGMPSFPLGKLGNALDFNGTSDGVELGNALNLAPAGFTVTFWFYADDFGVHDARFISKANGTQDANHWFMISTLDGTKLRLRLKAGGSTANLISAPGVVQAGQWTHVAAVYNGGTMTIYRNGESVASMSKSGSVDQSTTVNVALGNQPTAAGETRPFDGRMDDVRIYARALSTTEIETVYAAPSTLNAAPEITITAPTPASAFAETQTIALAATATDAEDGDLGAAVQWISSLDGPLGSGAALAVSGLSSGQHTIHAVVQDGAGVAAAATVQLGVLPGYVTWASLRGVPGLDPASDEYGNGLAALLEYAFHTEPLAFDFVPAQSGRTQVGSASHLTLDFPIRKDAYDLAYVLERATDFTDWAEVARYEIEGGALIRTLPVGGPEHVIYLGAEDEGPTWRVAERTAEAVTGHPSIYLRVRVLR